MRQLTHTVHCEIKLTNGEVVNVYLEKLQSIKAFVTSKEKNIPYENILLVDQENNTFQAAKVYPANQKYIFTVYDSQKLLQQLLYQNQLLQCQQPQQNIVVNDPQTENYNQKQQIIELNKEINYKANEIKDLHAEIDAIKNEKEKLVADLSHQNAQKDQIIQQLSQTLPSQNEEIEKQKRIQTQIESQRNSDQMSQIQQSMQLTIIKLKVDLSRAAELIEMQRDQLNEVRQNKDIEEAIKQSQQVEIKRLEEEVKALQEIKELKDKLSQESSKPQVNTDVLVKHQKEISELQATIRVIKCELEQSKTEYAKIAQSLEKKQIELSKMQEDHKKEIDKLQNGLQFNKQQNESGDFSQIQQRNQNESPLTKAQFDAYVSDQEKKFSQMREALNSKDQEINDQQKLIKELKQKSDEGVSQLLYQENCQLQKQLSNVIEELKKREVAFFILASKTAVLDNRNRELQQEIQQFQLQRKN